MSPPHESQILAAPTRKPPVRPVLVQPGAGSPAAAPDAPAAAVAPGVVRARADHHAIAQETGPPQKPVLWALLVIRRPMASQVPPVFRFEVLGQ